MRRYFLLFTIILTASCVYGQNNFETFNKLFKEKDTTKIKRLLDNWEESNPNDPELYTSAFNYYFRYSKRELLSLDKDQRGEESLQLTDSSGKVAGFMNTTLDYNPGQLIKAFFYIDKGIEKFPTRLDMRFGKCYVLKEIGDYEKFTSEVIKTVEYSRIISNKWLWTEDKKLEDGENFFLEGIHGYLKQLYDTEDDNLLENMKVIGDLTIKYYPNYIEILSITAVAYLLTKDFEKAINYLKQAEKVNPKDFIVLSNIAQAYSRKGDKENAIKYYELTMKYGDKRAKEEAKSYIKELKKQ